MLAIGVPKDHQLHLALVRATPAHFAPLAQRVYEHAQVVTTALQHVPTPSLGKLVAPTHPAQNPRKRAFSPQSEASLASPRKSRCLARLGHTRLN